jgi:hypothetical protein
MQSPNNILARYQLPLFFLLSYLLSWWSAPLVDGQIIPHGPALALVWKGQFNHRPQQWTSG